ncbi:MAG TPA: amino acid permease [Planctomycetota bacterium]|nr:amino acid permease [Planctomycetota bacterium]
MRPPGSASVQPGSGENHLRQLSPLLVWAVVFADIGTSIYYVPGMLHDMRGIGNLAPLFVTTSMLGFLLLAWKYVEICWRNPDGGGVVTVASNAFSPRWGLIGGLLITLDYFLTAAVSSVSGIHYLASTWPALDEHVAALAIAALLVLAVLNIVGIRESASISFLMALCALGIDLIVIGACLYSIRNQPAAWDHLRHAFSAATDVSAKTFVIGFAGAWLAFSGLESISQLSPAMKLPIRATARRGMWLVVITILITSPLLTLFAIELLSEATKLESSERFISELANLCGGLPLKLAVVATASALLLFAANTAIIGSYHVFLSLADLGYMPAMIGKRGRRFRTPFVAILVATVFPALVVWISKGDLTLLGELYAFGLLGAFLLSSGGLDVVRWREGQRGWGFMVGILTTLVVALAWFTNLLYKQEATLFGFLFVGFGMLIAMGTQQKWFADIFYEHPLVKRRAARLRGLAEQGLEQTERAEILSLPQAEAIVDLYPSSTLVALRTKNTGMIGEALARERGLGGKNIYAVYVEERAGLFVRESEVVTEEDEGMAALREAAQFAEREGFTLIPIWTVSHNAVEGIARAAQAMGVNGLVVGISHRSAVYHLLRGHVVAGLTRRLGSHVRLMLYT